MHGAGATGDAAGTAPAPELERSAHLMDSWVGGTGSDFGKITVMMPS